MSLGQAAVVVTVLFCAALAGVPNPTTLEGKIQNLQEVLHRQPVLKINVDRWKTYVRTQPRNYSMVVLFTALSPNINCPICRPAYDEFIILANSHRYANSDLKSLYFAVVDYEEAPQVFQAMNLNTAPIMYHFGPKLQGKKKPDQMDFQRHGFDADAMARFVADQCDVHIRVLRPPNYAAPVVIVLMGSVILGLLYMKRNNLEFLYSKKTWGIVCLSVTFIFLSGQMWNHIRGPPLMMTNPNTKETTIIHHSTQYQLVAETYIVGGLYAAVTVGMIILNEAMTDEPVSRDRKKGHKGFYGLTGSAVVFFGIGVVVVFFSLLLSVFRSKYRGYPYSLLFN